MSDTLDNFFGNKKQCDEMEDYLRSNLSEQKPICLVCGPPGSGKTLAVRLVCKKVGFVQIYFDTAELRSKRELGKMLNLKSSKNIDTLIMGGNNYKKHVIVLDQVDNFFINSRNTTDFIQYIKKKVGNSTNPVICICNLQYLTKIRKLHRYCKMVKFEPLSDSDLIKLADHLITKSPDEYKVPKNVVRKLVRLCGGDARQLMHRLKDARTIQNTSIKNSDLQQGEIYMDLKDSFKSFFKTTNKDNLVQKSCDLYCRDSKMLTMMVLSNVYPKMGDISGVANIASSISDVTDILESKRYSFDNTFDDHAGVLLFGSVWINISDDEKKKICRMRKINTKNPSVSMTNIRSAQKRYFQILKGFHPSLANRDSVLEIKKRICEKFSDAIKYGLNSEKSEKIFKEVTEIVEAFTPNIKENREKACIEFIDTIAKIKTMKDSSKLSDIWKKSLKAKMREKFEVFKTEQCGFKFDDEKKKDSKNTINFWSKR